MNEETIVIVGNGFDVANGLHSRYSDFKSWLKECDKSLYDALDRYIDVSGDWWNDFERNLSEFDILKLIDDSPKDYRRHNPRFPPTPSYPASSFFRIIKNQISLRFSEWAQSLNTSFVQHKVSLPTAILYISFNYTDTLEKRYAIQEDDILYIHGKASRGDKLVFGHGKSHYELERDTKRKYNLYESNDFYVPGTYGDIENQLTLEISFLEKFPYTQLVRYDKILAQAVLNANTIWAYGFSFSEVDFEYIEWIVERNPKLSWIVSWHADKDKKQIQETFHALGVTDYEMFHV